MMQTIERARSLERMDVRLRIYVKDTADRKWDRKAVRFGAGVMDMRRNRRVGWMGIPLFMSEYKLRVICKWIAVLRYLTFSFSSYSLSIQISSSRVSFTFFVDILR